MNRQELSTLIQHTPTETWNESHIHNITKINEYEDLSYRQVKQKYEEKFLSQLLEYPHSSIKGLEQFTHVDSIIGCTQFIDNIYQSHGKNVFVLENDYGYHKQIRGDSVKIENIKHLKRDSHIILSVPQAYCCGIPDLYDPILEVADMLGIHIHLDLAWWTISKGLNIDVTHKCIETIGTSLSKPFSLSRNKIGIRLSKTKMNDAVAVHNKRNLVPFSLLKIGLSYLEQNKISYMWDSYGDVYTQICETCKMRPLPIFFMAGELGKGNRHINLAIEKLHNW